MRLHVVHITMIISMVFLSVLIWAIYPTLPTKTDAQKEITAPIRSISAMADNWSAEPDFYVSFNALNPGLTVSQGASSLFDPSDDYWGLPRDEAGHFELVDIYCSGCHSLSIVMQQSADQNRWDELLNWMQIKQGMPVLPQDDRTNIIDYLAENFGTD